MCQHCVKSGNRVTYRHPERGVSRAVVLDHGADGLTVADRGEPVRVPWDDILHEEPPILIDLGALSGDETNAAIEAMHKALSEFDLLAWSRHENPLIADLVEAFWQEGMLGLEYVRDALTRIVQGEPAGTSAPGLWSGKTKAVAALYLQTKPPAEYTPQDWSILIDYLMQQYLPLDHLQKQAEMLAVKSTLMGKVQAYYSGVTDQQAKTIAAAMPSSLTGLSGVFRLRDAARAIAEYGSARLCEHVTGFSDAVRHSLKQTIFVHEMRRVSGDRTATPSALQQELLDQFGQYNRDWRMIAVTEAGEMQTQGVIASLEPGTQVRRIEQYHGACAWCRKIDGMIFRVVAADDPNKNGETDVWPGKTNYGRSAAPRKRVGNDLVERLPSERWWVAAGVQHPHCRGFWEPLRRLQAGEDPQFAEWMLAKAGISAKRG